MTNMFETSAFMGPILAQIGLTFIVFFLLYFRRLPAIFRSKATNEILQDRASLQKLPLPARFAGENYNHLFEAPVLFYAMCLASMITGLGNELSVQLAWAYVGLRVVHSAIHCTYNRVMHRFLVFSLSNFILIGMFFILAVEYWG